MENRRGSAWLKEISAALSEKMEKDKKRGLQQMSLIIGSESHVLDSKGAGGKNVYKWRVYVQPSDPTQGSLIGSVTFDLHPTFSPQVVAVTEAPFQLERSGWGTFKIGITVEDRNGMTHSFSHMLDFSCTYTRETYVIPVTAPEGPENPEIEDSKTQEVQRMSGVSERGMHGILGVGRNWVAPKIVTFCDEEARPGYASMLAHEYNEDPATLREKVRMLAALLRKAKHCVAYTGAGISTASGIDDYASKSKMSVATGSKAKRKKVRRGLAAAPTHAHYVMAALHRRGFLKHWVQQNHDGLPQKAGFPQSCLNEIHGAWFDPSNPVVPMAGSLRDDLFHWMLQEEQAADLCLTMGTSLCGMNADRMVTTPASKFVDKKQGLGSVIIGFQQTQLDEMASLRIYARIDEVMQLLAEELELQVDETEFQLSEVPPEQAVPGKPHIYLVPYDKHGMPCKTLHPWDLSVGARVMLTAGPGKGFKGVVRHPPTVTDTPSGREHSFMVKLPCTREGPELGKKRGLYALGTWFVEDALAGRLTQLPLINC